MYTLSTKQKQLQFAAMSTMMRPNGKPMTQQEEEEMYDGWWVDHFAFMRVVSHYENLTE
jgi:hypothetical protein